jgi:hypothetical protein
MKIQHIIILSVCLIFGLFSGSILNGSVVSTSDVSVEVLSDSLPLDNGGEVVVDANGMVYITIENLEYLSQKRRSLKKVVTGAIGLKARLN